MMLMDQLRRLILNGTQNDGENSGSNTPSPDTTPSSSITTIHHQNPHRLIIKKQFVYIQILFISNTRYQIRLFILSLFMLFAVM